MRNYGDFRHACNPHDNYMHVTENTLRHRDSPHLLWGKHLQCGTRNLQWYQYNKVSSYTALTLTEQALWDVSHGHGSRNPENQYIAFCYNKHLQYYFKLRSLWIDFGLIWGRYIFYNPPTFRFFDYRNQNLKQPHYNARDVNRCCQHKFECLTLY